jgi:hypothetical protein
MSSKNFVVSFISKESHNSLFAAYYRQIMEIMLLIDTSVHYDDAIMNKIGYIQNYLANDLVNIEYIIYVYGFAEALREYNMRFGNRNIEPSILMFDLATLVIDNVISIYEVYHLEDEPVEAVEAVEAAEAVEALADHEYDSDDTDNFDDFDDREFQCDVSSIYCENPTEASLHFVSEDQLNVRLDSRSFSDNDTVGTADTEVHYDDYDDY